jgi:hypothetical protein
MSHDSSRKKTNSKTTFIHLLFPSKIKTTEGERENPSSSSRGREKGLQGGNQEKGKEAGT